MQSQKLLFAALMAACSFAASAADVDDNPPGPLGGPGSNWENRPGPQGGPGTSPDRRRLTQEQREQVRERLQSMTPEERQARFQQMKENHPNWRRDRDNNPPGAVGGPGTNWENPPGPRGGPGTSPDLRFRDRDNNPPGALGGPGTNWENRPGPRGGPGASPDRHPRRR